MAYTKLASLRENLYCPTAPLLIVGGALLKDEKSGKIVAQLKFRNIAEQKIVAVKARITSFDVCGNQLLERAEYQYLDFNALQNDEFGQKQAILLPDQTARDFEAECLSVVFADKTSWVMPDGAQWSYLPKRMELQTQLGYELAEQYKIDTISQAKFVPQEHEDLYLCTCGAVYSQSESACPDCGQGFSALNAAMNKDLLAEHKDARDKEIAEQKVKVEAERREQEERNRQTRQKRLRLLGIGVTTVAAVIVFVILLNNMIIPNSKYNGAVALMDAGKYEEAIEAFTALDGYKDSAEQIANCETAILDGKYNDAVALMNKEKYEDAIAAFEKLDGYKDSNNKILECKYNNAVALMDAGKYEEAIYAFTALDGYKDSDTQIQNCETAIMDGKYNAAVALMNEGKIVKAYKALIALDGYKDSDEKAKELHEQYPLECCAIGDYITFGRYEQDDNTSNGKEDIEWLVLDKKYGKALVISKYALDNCRQYNTSDTAVTWETCSLRKWLNDTFISAAFTDAEKSAIPTVTVSADKNPDYSTDPGNATQDKVFLLSITEVNKYFSSDSARQCEATAYAEAQGAFVSGSNGNCRWRLRSPGFHQGNVAHVKSGGAVYENGFGGHFNDDDAVRPAIWITIEE